MTTFSIIVPVYKVEKYIRQCLESLESQTFRDFEAIFVDDCGNDRSMEIVEEYASRDERIKIVRNNKNIGVAASRNKALDFCSGEYTTCLDPDDWFTPDALEVIYNTFQQHDVGSVWFDANMYDEKKQAFGEESVLACTYGYIYTVPSHIVDYSEYCWGKAYKTSAIKDYNITWPVGMNICEDAVFYYKYFTYNPKGIVLENRLYNYRVREASAATNALKGKLNLTDLYEAIRNIYDFYKNREFFEKYKITILKYLRRNTFLATFVFNSYNKSQKMTKHIINDFCFPDEFKEFDIPLNPLVSVIIPMYDEDFDYTNLIRSVQCQSHRNIELICVCKPHSKYSHFLDKYQKNDFRIKQVECNDNYEFRLSDCMKYINGNYIMFVHKDTSLKGNLIELMVDKFKEANVPTILYNAGKLKDEIDEDGYFSIDGYYKSLIAKKKFLPIFNKYYLSNCEYDVSKLFEKYKDFYLSS